MTVHLTGYDALALAYYADHNVDVLVNTKFFVDKDGKRIPVDPFQTLEMVEKWGLPMENLVCEAMSVWDYMQCVGTADGPLAIHPCQRTVLVLTRDFGEHLSGGICGFAVERSVFEKAALWAKHAPLTEPENDLYVFLGRLSPRLSLGVGAWQNDGDLRRHAREIATALIAIFGVDPESAREILQARNVVGYEREFTSYGGIFWISCWSGSGRPPPGSSGAGPSRMKERRRLRHPLRADPR
ncbi:MAG: hypothetical protein D084_Lepto4C00289G0007 [Leptospirillum sp. Group IV 'UBA BS']|nr:MAG: hypothetical protein D084_Lepto4C00289G0007 [Leptospirillum sp. Group IV 'UBA BS']